jgi:Leucine-rich repeat (LRR) protein
MEIERLYQNLKDAYTPENLGVISGRIIGMFREHRYDGLRYMQKLIDEYTPCREEKINKVFSKLIMLYHPDRLSHTLSRLNEAFKRGDFEELYTMSHILHIQHLEPEQVTVSEVITDEDLAEEFGWDEGMDGFSYFTGQEEVDEEPESDYQIHSFLLALKRRVYGNLNVDFPMYLLEDLEEIDMADYELESLEGIEACRYAKIVDLSNNNLTDLSELQDLHQIERLFLSNNHIGMIDVLSNLTVLQELDLSYNDVDDLSPLFELSHLNYLNVMGNRIPSWQLEQIEAMGVTVVA